MELATKVWDIPLPPELEHAPIFDGCDQLAFPVPEELLADIDALALFCNTVTETTQELISGNEGCKTCGGLGFVAGTLTNELCDACLSTFAVRWEKKLKRMKTVKGVCETCKKNIDGRHSLVRAGRVGNGYKDYHWKCKPDDALDGDYSYYDRKGNGVSYVSF